ncbi:MAG: bifunctional hydroxymethylpyrimidine kinase/phosphomethylpyrimidine kinase, partial [Promethearchaeota archaeon]
MRPICLTIAGSDPSSGAGVQADIRTIDRIGVYPFSVITAITYQTAKNFFGFKSLSDCIENQLNAILTNYPVKYIKIGMIPDLETLEIITRTLRKGKYFIVYDPVTISSAGERLSTENLEQKIEELLFPLVN